MRTSVKGIDEYILMIVFVSLFFKTKPQGVTTQMKALDKYILMVLFVLLLKRVYFLVNET